MDTYHLYSDGNYFPRAKKSGFGGYIESPNGEIIIEYSEQIKESKYYHNFEILGIIHGLKIAKSKGIKNIISHCDDKTTTKKLIEFFENNNSQLSLNLKPELFHEVLDLSKSFNSLNVQYIPREKNKYADSLSRRYSSLMENNFLKNQEIELKLSQKNLENGNKTNKRIFFSHQSIITSPNKNNPFLVAPIRNNKLRKLSKQQKEHSYHYLYTEVFSQQNQTTFRTFHYDNHGVITSINEKSIPYQDALLIHYCDFFTAQIIEIKKSHKNLWISSNYQPVNSILEQKEKVPNYLFDSILKIHNALNGFDRIYFNNLPFKHKFSQEIETLENVKQKLTDSISSLDELLDNFSKSSFTRDKGKCFGAIVRHHLRNYKKTLEREIEHADINKIIEETILSLKSKGYTNLPLQTKIKT